MSLGTRQWLTRLHALDAAGQAAPDWVTGLTESPDGSLVALGFSIGGGIARPFLARLGSNGDVIWQRYTSNHDYKTSSGQQVFGMAMLQSGEIVSAGWEYGSYNGTGEGQYTIPLRINPIPSEVMGGPSRPGIWDGVLTWHNQNGDPIRRRWIGSARLDQLNGVAVGPSGTIVVAGWSDGNVSGTSAGEVDLLVQAISPTGSTLWSKQLGGSRDDRPTAIATTSDDGTVVVGHTKSSFTGLINEGEEDAFLLHFNALGDVHWARSIATPGPDHAYGVHVLPDGDILVTGRMAGIDWTPNGGDLGDAFLARYDADGSRRWLTRFGSSAYEYGRSIAVTANGDIFVSGRTEGNFQGLTNQGGFDGFVSRFSADGIHQASQNYGTSGNDVVNQLLTLSNGDLVVAGMSEGNFNEFGNTSGSYDLFIERLSFPSGDSRVSLQSGSISLLEGKPDSLTPFRFTVTRSGDLSITSSVSWAVNGRGRNISNADDFEGGILPAGSLTFLPGQSSSTITVNVRADFQQEPDESFAVTLSNSTGATIEIARAVGLIRNDDLIGTTANDTLTGTARAEFIAGLGGQNTLTGRAGADLFSFRFGHSSADAPDRITDFRFEEDRIALLGNDTRQLQPAPDAFSRVANNRTATNLRQLAQAVFADADALTPGRQPLAANSAAIVRSTNPTIAGTYLLINNPNTNFNSEGDLVINITGFRGTLPALGSIAVNTVFS